MSLSLKEIEENNRVLQGFLEKCDKFIFKNEFKSDKIFFETISIKQFQILLIYFLKENNFFKEISDISCVSKIIVTVGVEVGKLFFCGFIRFS